jgi:hypothetical protein
LKRRRRGWLNPGLRHRNRRRLGETERNAARECRAHYQKSGIQRFHPAFLTK